MTTLNEMVETRSPRECDCPNDPSRPAVYITRCAHLGDEWVVLHDSVKGGKRVGYWICAGVGEVADHMSRSSTRGRYLGAETEANALAAFYAAEEELLRGGS